MYYLKLSRRAGDTTPVVYVGPYDEIRIEEQDAIINKAINKIVCYGGAGSVLETFLMDTVNGTEIVVSPHDNILGTLVRSAAVAWHEDTKDGVPIVPPFTLELKDKPLRSEGLYEITLRAEVEYTVVLKADNVEDAITDALSYHGPGKVVRQITPPDYPDRDKIKKLT